MSRDSTAQPRSGMNDPGLKLLPEVCTDRIHLLVIECACGFHIGLDATYIDQVEDIAIACPACSTLIDTEAFSEEEG